MQYEKPNLEIVTFTVQDVITLSVGSGDGGTVDGETGGWS